MFSLDASCWYRCLLPPCCQQTPSSKLLELCISLTQSMLRCAYCSNSSTRHPSSAFKCSLRLSAIFKILKIWPCWKPNQVSYWKEGLSFVLTPPPPRANSAMKWDDYYSCVTISSLLWLSSYTCFKQSWMLQWYDHEQITSPELWHLMRIGMTVIIALPQTDCIIWVPTHAVGIR